MRLIQLGLALALACIAPPLAAQTQVPPAGTIKTEKGDFRVPGQAYLDGRNLEAQPPSTSMNLRLWESPAGNHALCTAEHGRQVDLVEVQRNVEEGRFYFRIKAGNCEGWVPESALSPKKNLPVGSRR